MLEFAPHLNNKHQKNAQQYRNFKVYDDSYRNGNRFQKVNNYDEKLIDELIDEYLKESNYDDTLSRNENGMR
jgi:DNA-binding SARP family transcriptional activator